MSSCLTHFSNSVETLALKRSKLRLERQARRKTERGGPQALTNWPQRLPEGLILLIGCGDGETTGGF